MRYASGCSVAGAIALWSIASAAHEPLITYPSDTPSLERTVAELEWERTRAGTHFFAEAGAGAFYAPEMIAFFYLDEIDFYPLPQVGVAGPTTSVRIGANIGVTPNVDVRLGVGSLLGAGILHVKDVFLAYPHGTVQVGFGPGDVYRARIGLMLGALLFGLDDQRLHPSTASFGLHVEISPVVLQFGPHQSFELALNQGLGVFITPYPERCAVIPSCLPVPRPDVLADFGGYTTVSFAAIVD